MLQGIRKVSRPAGPGCDQLPTFLAPNLYANSQTTGMITSHSNTGVEGTSETSWTLNTPYLRQRKISVVTVTQAYCINYCQ
jgi:hypothetical protein